MYFSPGDQNFHTIDMFMYGIQIGNEFSMEFKGASSDTYSSYVRKKLRLGQRHPLNEDLDYVTAIDLAIEWVEQSNILPAEARAMDNALG